MIVLNHTSKGTVIEKFNDDWYALVVREIDDSKPELPGGRSLDSENEEQTFVRELVEETGVLLGGLHEVFIEFPNKKVFFLATKMSNLMSVGETRLFFGSRGQEIKACLWEVKDLLNHIFPPHKDGFTEIIYKKAFLDDDFRKYMLSTALTDPDFYANNSDLIDAISSLKG